MSDVTFCSGMQRAATLWAYQVSIILQSLAATRLGKALRYGALDVSLSDKVMASVQSNDVWVLKTSVLSPAGVARLARFDIKHICMLRDPRDCVLSRQIHKNETFNQSLDAVATDLKWVGLYFRLKRSLFLRYEDMVLDPGAAIHQIAAYLDMSLEKRLVKDIIERTDISAMRELQQDLMQQFQSADWHDPITGMSANHIHSGASGQWRNHYDAEQITQLHQQLGVWIVSLGYDEASVLRIPKVKH